MKPAVLPGLLLAAGLAACGGGGSSDDGGSTGGEGGGAPPVVSAGYDKAWEFDDTAGWTFTGAAPQLANGRLLFDVSVPANPNPFPPMFGCSGSAAEAAYGDATLAAGGYAQTDFEFVQESEGAVTVDVRYAGRRASFGMPGPAGKVRLSWTGTDRAALYVDDVFVRDLTTSAVAATERIEIDVLACGAPNSPAQRSRLVLDRVAIRAR